MEKRAEKKERGGIKAETKKKQNTKEKDERERSGKRTKEIKDKNRSKNKGQAVRVVWFGLLHRPYQTGSRTNYPVGEN